MTLLADVNHTGSQKDLVSNWEPAHSLVEDAFSGANIGPCLPTLAVARLPLCLRWGNGPVHSQLALLLYSLSPLFCKQAWRCLAAVAAKSLQLCPTLCDLTDGSPPGSPVPGILQARTLEWVAISFSNA